MPQPFALVASPSVTCIRQPKGASTHLAEGVSAISTSTHYVPLSHCIGHITTPPFKKSGYKCNVGNVNRFSRVCSSLFPYFDNLSRASSHQNFHDDTHHLVARLLYILYYKDIQSNPHMKHLSVVNSVAISFGSSIAIALGLDLIGGLVFKPWSAHRDGQASKNLDFEAGYYNTITLSNDSESHS